MKCTRCGKEMKNTIGSCYVCDSCGFSANDLFFRQEEIITPSNILYPPIIDNDISHPEAVDVSEYNLLGNHGWICPKCGAVLSPYTSFCPFCVPKNNTINATSVNDTVDIDWLKHQTTTVTGGNQ